MFLRSLLLSLLSNHLFNYSNQKNPNLSNLYFYCIHQYSLSRHQDPKFNVMHLFNCFSVYFCSNTQKVSRFLHYEVSLLCQFDVVKCIWNWGNFCLYWCDTNASVCQGVLSQEIRACLASHGDENPWVSDPRMRLSYTLPLERDTGRESTGMGVALNVLSWHCRNITFTKLYCREDPSQAK